MCSFGPPPPRDAPLSYPGISGRRFNPVEAQKVYGESLKKEKEAGYVHRVLDSLDKLGLDEEWANDVSRGDGLMPDYESLGEVYHKLGWQVLQNGRAVAPDANKLVKRRRKSREKRAALCHHHKALCPHQKLGSTSAGQKLGSTSAGLARSVSEPNLGGVSRKVEQRAKPPAPSLQGKKGHGKQKAQAAAPGLSKVAVASHKTGSTLGQATLVRMKPLRPGRQEAPSAPIRGARHIVRPDTALVHAVMRKSASTPGFANYTAKRAAERETMRQSVT